MQTYLKLNNSIDITDKATRTWFYMNEITSIYKCPPPTTNNVVVAVVSFGGGLYGNIDASGNLTDGDVHAYWSSIGISVENHPKVVVKPIGGAINNPIANDGGSTIENTIDVETIGATCPSSKLTIVLYIAPNSFVAFNTIMNAILNDTIYVPNVISISWGAPEIYYGNVLLNSINSLLQTANNRNINITVASGDNGSNDGVGGKGNYCDFPSSSPCVIACGGTNLICPNYIYNNTTREIAWSAGGGGISSYFSKPTYQRSISGTKRNTPDLALVADPNTGVLYLIGGTQMIVGGTSIVAPLVAGFLAATNINVLFNPIGYSAILIGFNDIVSGSNGGYSAKVNYDNCTGLGSFKGDILASIINYQLTLNVSSLNILGKKTFTIEVTSSSPLNRYIKWTSSNTRVATVSATGVVTSLANGTTIVTASGINPYVNKTVTVTVFRITPRKNFIKPGNRRK